MNPIKIGDLEIKVPIIQGGMGIGISLSGLAAAVANEGGVGVIATAGLAMYEKDYVRNWVEANLRNLRSEIKKAREMTDGILGVNIMVALTNYADIVKTSIEEKIDIIFAGAGMPLNLPEFLTKDSITKLVPIVSSAKGASLLCRKWKEKYNYLPDAIVVEGPQAGGHLGFKAENLDKEEFQIDKLIPQVKASVKEYEDKYDASIPVIAAGGIYTGEDIKDIMDLGADAVQLGTRFVTTHECDASIDFKKMYIDSEGADMAIIHSPVGMPGRAVRNEFIKKVERGEKRPIKCPYHCLKTCDVKTTPYCIVHALISAAKGKMKHGFAFSGSNAFRATEIVSVKELFQQLISEYKAAL